MKRASVWAATLVVGSLLCWGCGGGVSGTETDSGGTPPPPPPCTGGTDQDGDGYGPGCPGGADCDDSNAGINPSQKELCDGKDNNCDGKVDENEVCGGNCPGCGSTGNGSSPFPNDPKGDPNLKDSNGVKLDPNGDLTLDAAMVNFNYLWIANTYDTAGDSACSTGSPSNPELCRGTLSKVDTVKMAEVARYFTVTCTTTGGATGCTDINGRAITKAHVQTPSRTAVDFNFDCWVANRNVHGGQPSATKVANDPADCIDRNKNGKIDTSKDQNGDSKITIDCNGDGKPDNGSTVCAGTLAGKPPEFLGDDDECILFTVAYGDKDDIGRSICLDTGKNNVGASNAWVGTFFRPENGRGNNRFYGINGNTGKIEAEVELPAGHHTYGCMADANHIIWSTDIGSSGKGNTWNGSLAYFHSINKQAGPLLRGPSASYWKDAAGQYHHYGITINADQHVWLGGWSSSWVLRYKPDRASFDSLSKGTWTRIDLKPGWHTRGIAADNRGKIWVSIHEGFLFRLDQSLPDGTHNKKAPVLNTDYWAVKADTVIGSGVDFNGHLWGVGHGNDIASRLDVDAQGNVIQPSTGTTKSVSVGKSPYTYSDFTGYGLMNFVRPQGRWVYQHKACPAGVKATWQGVTWNATTPPGTSVIVRVRSGESDTTMGGWSKEFGASPAQFGPASAQPLSPNPATYLHVEFTLKNTTKDTTPILHDYKVSFVCANVPG